MGGKRRGRSSVVRKGNEGVKAGQGRWRMGSSGNGRREGREDRGAKYLYNNRLLGERREEDGGEREESARSDIEEGNGGREKDEEEECGT